MMKVTFDPESDPSEVIEILFRFIGDKYLRSI